DRAVAAAQRFQDALAGSFGLRRRGILGVERFPRREQVHPAGARRQERREVIREALGLIASEGEDEPRRGPLREPRDESGQHERLRGAAWAGHPRAVAPLEVLVNEEELRSA